MENNTFVTIVIYNKEHCVALLALLNDYMADEMGVNKSMPGEFGAKIIKG